MARAVSLSTPVQTKDGSIIKATIDGNMVLLAGATIYRATNELRLPPRTRVVLEEAIKQARPVVSFNYGDGKFRNI